LKWLGLRQKYACLKNFPKNISRHRHERKVIAKAAAVAPPSGSGPFADLFPGWRPKRPYPGLYCLSPSATNAESRAWIRTTGSWRAHPSRTNARGGACLPS